MPFGASRTPASQLHGVVYASKTTARVQEAVPPQNGPFSFPNGAGHAGCSRRSTRAYKTIGPTSQHRPKVSTVTMVVTQGIADDEVLRLHVAFTSRDDRRDGSGEKEHGGQVAG